MRQQTDTAEHFSRGNASDDQDDPLIVARVGGRPGPRALSTASFRR